MAKEDRLARALGAFSLGLGAAQLVAPRRFSEWIGVKPTDRRSVLVRLVGTREIGAGVGLVARPRPIVWQASRVAGDAMDLALLAAALRARGTRRGRVLTVAAAVGAIAVVDAFVTTALANPSDGDATRDVPVRKSITVNRSAAELYAFWRDLRNLARFMTNVESVDVSDAGRLSHWTVRAPLVGSVEWDAEIVEDRPDELIAWRSLPGAQIDNAGEVRFLPAPRGRGTEIHVWLSYAPPGGPLGSAVAKVLGEEPSQQVAEDLRRLKQLMEIGEVVRSEATLDGGRFPFTQRPAQPAEPNGR